MTLHKNEDILINVTVKDTNKCDFKFCKAYDYTRTFRLLYNTRSLRIFLFIFFLLRRRRFYNTYCMLTAVNRKKSVGFGH